MLSKILTVLEYYSRIGIPEEGNSDNPMNFQDIMADAERIKTRRENLKELGLL